MTVFAMIGKAGVAGAWGVAQVFSAEVFPTVVRFYLVFNLYYYYM